MPELFDLLTPEAGVAADAAPVMQAGGVTPSAEEVRDLVGGVPMACEVNRVHPCTERHPEPASYLIVWSECNCDPLSVDYDATTPICGPDVKVFLNEIRQSPVVFCMHCGFQYNPAKTSVKEVIAV